MVPSVCVQGVHGDHGPKLPSTVRFLVWKANISIGVRKDKVEKKKDTKPKDLSSGNHNSFQNFKKIKVGSVYGKISKSCSIGHC